MYSPVVGCVGDYPLLSEAIKSGLFHPNCKDSTSTYYEGITTLQPVTEEEQAEMKRREKLEAKENYCKNEAKKNRRIAEYSLDADNKRTYSHRADVFEQKAQNAEKALAKSGESGIIESEGVKGLEQAKKRDHKVLVTREAIHRVDYVKLSDFSEEQALAMQSKHRQVLEIAMNENNSNEVLLIEDLDFKSEVKILGSEFVVSPGKNPFAVSVIAHAERQSLVYLHNHPSTNTFSVGDIDTFVCERAIKVMSVVTNQGEVYVLNKLANYNFSRVRELLASVYTSFPEGEIDDKEFVRRFLKICRKGGIEYAKAK